MILWTIQHKEAYLKMQSSGVLRADANHLFCEDDFRDAYDWMSCQMKNVYLSPRTVFSILFGSGTPGKVIVNVRICVALDMLRPALRLFC